MSDKRYYSGIGSRETPIHIQVIMNRLALLLEKDGMILRSGGAKGADTAFAQNVKDANKIIFLPTMKIKEEAFTIARDNHYNKKNFHRFRTFVQQLLARNVYQVIGEDFKTKSEFVVCWTQDASFRTKNVTSKTGGTGLAINIANAYGIKVYNLANNYHYSQINNMIEELELKHTS